MSTATYNVDGMSCDHCVRAITEEVNKIDEISEVNVDLAGKTVTVTGDTVDDAAVRAAIDEAGYTVVG
jgi:copper chaperone